MIEYRTFGTEQTAAVCGIYEANRWSSYLGDMARIKKALKQSLYTLGAFDDGRLVGFVRCIGDTEFILYVQDVIVLPEYQRQGIGRELMRRTSEAFPAVRQFLLITDEDDEASNAFYQAIGMTKDMFESPVSHYFRSNGKIG